MKRKCTGSAQVALEDEQCQDASPFWLVNRFACNSCLACSTRHPPFHPVLQQAVMNVCKHAHNTRSRLANIATANARQPASTPAKQHFGKSRRPRSCLLKPKLVVKFVETATGNCHFWHFDIRNLQISGTSLYPSSFYYWLSYYQNIVYIKQIIGYRYYYFGILVVRLWTDKLCIRKTIYQPAF